MIASFLHKSFIAPNIRTFARQHLVSQLDVFGERLRLEQERIAYRWVVAALREQ